MATIAERLIEAAGAVAVLQADAERHIGRCYAAEIKASQLVEMNRRCIAQRDEADTNWHNARAAHEATKSDRDSWKGRAVHWQHMCETDLKAAEQRVAELERQRDAAFRKGFEACELGQPRVQDTARIYRLEEELRRVQLRTGQLTTELEEARAYARSCSTQSQEDAKRREDAEKLAADLAQELGTWRARFSDPDTCERFIASLKRDVDNLRQLLIDSEGKLRQACEVNAANALKYLQRKQWVSQQLQDIVDNVSDGAGDIIDKLRRITWDKEKLVGSPFCEHCGCHLAVPAPGCSQARLHGLAGQPAATSSSAPAPLPAVSKVPI